MLDYGKLKETDPKDIQELVSLYAVAFFQWRTKARTRVAMPIEKAFASWWMSAGPIRIPIKDIRQVKQDILAEVLAVHNTKEQTPAT